MNGVIILSRTDSTRFPRKALFKFSSKTLLEWCIESLKGGSNYKIIIATTNREIDDPIVEIANNNNVEYFRGDKDNVAKRVLECAKKFNLTAFARINGDSPFVRKDLIINAFKILENSNYDFVTNLVPRHFPYGISVEVFKTEIFREVYNQFITDQHKEHVTTFFYENLTKFNVYFQKYLDGGINDHHIRLVVDTKEDANIIGKLLDHFKQDIQNIQMEKIVKHYKFLIS